MLILDKVKVVDVNISSRSRCSFADEPKTVVHNSSHPEGPDFHIFYKTKKKSFKTELASQPY